MKAAGGIPPGEQCPVGGPQWTRELPRPTTTKERQNSWQNSCPLQGRSLWVSGWSVGGRVSGSGRLQGRGGTAHLVAEEAGAAAGEAAHVPEAQMAVMRGGEQHLAVHLRGDVGAWEAAAAPLRPVRGPSNYRSDHGVPALPQPRGPASAGTSAAEATVGRVSPEGRGLGEGGLRSAGAGPRAPPLPPRQVGTGWAMGWGAGGRLPGCS